MLWFSKKKLIGLDIGTSTTKIAELDLSRRGATLNHFAILPTPPAAFSSGDIVNPSAIGETIREVVKECGTKRKLAAVGLGGASVIVKRISIPQMDPKLIDEQLRWEAEQYVPYDINEVNLDYQVLNKSSGETMELLLIAAVQSHVYKYSEACKLGGVDCHVVDVNGFALANCFRANYGDMHGNTVALINLGAAATNITVLDSGEVVFSRDIPIGGSSYTHDLSNALSIGLEDAEAIKVGMSSGEIPDEAMRSVKATHEIITEEVRSTFEFFQNTSRTHGINRAFITGGGSKVPGLAEAVGRLVPCEPMNPFLRINYDRAVFSNDYIRQVQDFAAIAVGLGLREAES